MSEQGNGPEEAAGAGPPSEEELRQALDEQMRNTRVEELLVQSVVSLLNLSARRVALEEERDLAQAKLGIDAVRALTGLLPGEIAEQVQQALSRLQLDFAQAAGGDGDAAQPGTGQTPDSGADPSAGAGSGPDAAGQGPGRAGTESKLWTPPGVG